MRRIEIFSAVKIETIPKIIILIPAQNIGCTYTLLKQCLNLNGTVIRNYTNYTNSNAHIFAIGGDNLFKCAGNTHRNFVFHML